MSGHFGTLCFKGLKLWRHEESNQKKRLLQVHLVWNKIISAVARTFRVTLSLNIVVYFSRQLKVE